LKIERLSVRSERRLELEVIQPVDRLQVEAQRLGFCLRKRYVCDEYNHNYTQPEIKMKKRLIGIFAATILLQAAPVHAQSMRTWLSGVGDDANPCSRTAPCRTFAGAVSKTAAGGEISVLDPGSFGTLTITKSISIVAVGFEGSVTASMGTININAGPNDVVNLDGLYIEGNGTGTNAIAVRAAGAVNIRNTTIIGFRGNPGLAINVAPTGTTPTQVYLSDVTLLANTGGVLVAPTASAPTNVYLDRVRVGNSNTGIQVNGKATAFVANSTIVGNSVGLSLVNGGEITSFGNNVLAGNATSDRPSATLPLQ
jgi:hypothetical protein